MPGQVTALPVSADVGTGAEDMWRQLGGAGQALIGLGQVYYRRQEETETAEAMSDLKDTVHQILIQFDQETDTDAYQDIAGEAWSKIQAREVKHPGARRRYELALTKYKPEFDRLVYTARKEQIDSNWEYAKDNLRAEAIDTGNYRGLLALYQKAVKDGRFTQDAVDADMAVVMRLSERRQAMAVGMNDPDWILERNSYDKLHADFPHLRPEDFPYIFDSAQNHKNDINQANDEWWAALKVDTLQKAVDMTTNEFRQQLDQTQGLDIVQETELMTIFSRARNLWHEKSVNPWTTTQNYPLLYEVQRKIDAGGPMTLGQLDQLWTMNGQLNWSLSQQNSLRRQLRERNTPIEKDDYRATHPVVAPMFKNYDSLYYARGTTNIEEERYLEWAQGRLVLDVGLRALWPNTQAMKDYYDRATEDRRNEVSKSWLRKLFGG